MERTEMSRDDQGGPGVFSYVSPEERVPWHTSKTGNTWQVSSRPAIGQLGKPHFPKQPITYTRAIKRALAAAQVLCAMVVLAQTATPQPPRNSSWTGGTGNWFGPNDTCVSWDTCAGPGTNPGESGYTDNVFINAPGSAVTLNGGARIANVTLASGNSLTPIGTGYLEFDGSGSATLDNDGNIYLADSSYISVFGSPATLTLTISGGGVITLDTGNNSIGGSSATLINQETLQGLGSIGGGQMTLVNQGTIDANVIGGTLTVKPIFNGNLTNTGTLEASNGGILDLENQGTAMNNTGGTIEALNGSTVIMGAGTYTGGTLTTAGTGAFHVLGGGANPFLNGVTNAGTYQILSAGSATLEGTINNTGTIQLLSQGGETDLFVNGSVTLAGSGTVMLVDSSNPNNLVAGFAAGSQLTNKSTMEGAGTIGNGILTVVNQGTINANVAAHPLAFADAGFTNSGLVEVTNGATLNISSQTFNNQGTLQVDAGSTINAASYTQTTGTTLVNGTLSSNSALNIQGGVIGGIGTVAANVTNGGTTVPGAGANTGIFTITGNDTQGGTSAVNIRIGGRTVGAQFDQFNTSGAISLNGILAVTALGGFRPATGDTFTVMKFNSSSGAFASITGLDFGSGCSLQPIFNPNDLTLQAISNGPVVVNVSPGTPSVPPLGRQQFTQTTTGDCNLAVTWSVQEGPAGGTVTNTGLYTAPAYPGIFHVVATSVADPTKTGVATVTVTGSVLITPSRATVAVSGTQKFGSNAMVTWSVQEGAAGGAIDATGLYTAPATEGVFHVVAVNQFDATNQAVAPVTVTGTLPRFTYVTNSTDNTISLYWISANTGQLLGNGYISTGGTGADSIALAPAGPFAFVANQGSNTVSAFSVDPVAGRLTPVSGSPFAAGTSPQSVAVASGQFLFTANSGSNDISAFTIDPMAGVLTPVTGSPFSAGTAPQSVAVAPAGAFLYTANATSNDISGFSIDPMAGALTPVPGSPFTAGANPRSVVISPSAQFLFVVNHDSNTVSGFGIGVAGGLTAVPGSPFATGGTGAVAVTTDAAGKFLYVANRDSNDVSAFTIDGVTGALTAIAGSPFAAGALPRSVSVEPANAFLYVGSEGSNVTVLALDPATGALSSASAARARGQAVSIAILGGANPVTPAPQFAYTANSGSNDVTGYSVAPSSGVLTPVPGSPFAAGTQPRSVAEHPTAGFLYGTNATSVFGFSVDPGTGNLTPVPGSPFPAGTDPRSVAIDPSGRFLYAVNNGTGAISAFTIDLTAGGLTAVAGSPFASGPGARAAARDPTGRFLYVVNQTAGTVSAFAIDSTSGALTAVGTVAAGANPESITVHVSGQFAFVANHDSNTVLVYSIDATTGALTQADAQAAAGAVGLTAIAIAPSGQFAYAAAETSNNVSGFVVNPTTGALTPVLGTPFGAGTGPQSVAVETSGQFVFSANQTSNDVWVYSLNPATGGLTPIVGSPFSAGTNPLAITTTGTIQ